MSCTEEGPGAKARPHSPTPPLPHPQQSDGAARDCRGSVSRVVCAQVVQRPCRPLEHIPVGCMLARPEDPEQRADAQPPHGVLRLGGEREAEEEAAQLRDCRGVV